MIQKNFMVMVTLQDLRYQISRSRNDLYNTVLLDHSSVDVRLTAADYFTHVVLSLGSTLDGALTPVDLSLFDVNC